MTKTQCRKCNRISLRSRLDAQIHALRQQITAETNIEKKKALERELASTQAYRSHVAQML